MTADVPEPLARRRPRGPRPSRGYRVFQGVNAVILTVVVAVTLYPFDVQQQADALYSALTMPAPERREMLAAAGEQVRKHDVRRWLDAQLEDMRALLESAGSDGALSSNEQ